jgi:hypothetical protein
MKPSRDSLSYLKLIIRTSDEMSPVRNGVGVSSGVAIPLPIIMDTADELARLHDQIFALKHEISALRGNLSA